MAAPGHRCQLFSDGNFFFFFFFHQMEDTAQLAQTTSMKVTPLPILSVLLAVFLSSMSRCHP